MKPSGQHVSGGGVCVCACACVRAFLRVHAIARCVEMIFFNLYRPIVGSVGDAEQCVKAAGKGWEGMLDVRRVALE